MRLLIMLSTVCCLAIALTACGGSSSSATDLTCTLPDGWTSKQNNTGGIGWSVYHYAPDESARIGTYVSDQTFASATRSGGAVPRSKHEQRRNWFLASSTPITAFGLPAQVSCSAEQEFREDQPSGRFSLIADVGTGLLSISIEAPLATMREAGSAYQTFIDSLTFQGKPLGTPIDLAASMQAIPVEIDLVFKEATFNAAAKRWELTIANRGLAPATGLSGQADGSPVILSERWDANTGAWVSVGTHSSIEGMKTSEPFPVGETPFIKFGGNFASARPMRFRLPYHLADGSLAWQTIVADPKNELPDHTP